MKTETKKRDWSAGELVTLRMSTTLLKRSDLKSYSNFVNSRYVCIREATKGQRGILVKTLGKAPCDYVMLVSGKPFCKDQRDELFESTHYYSYSFPKVEELKEVLDIIRLDMDIQQKLIDNNMFINPNGSFWVSDTKSLFFGMKRRLQYYDPSTGSLATANSYDERHQRLTIAYF